MYKKIFRGLLSDRDKALMTELMKHKTKEPMKTRHIQRNHMTRSHEGNRESQDMKFDYD